MVDTNKERQKAVRNAWRCENKCVRQGMGTRDWTQSEQREIVSKGRAKGYEGHHMKSVKVHPQHAGNSQNIQFLNRSEHISGAHLGNTHNTTNGYYDTKTGTMHSFGNRNPTPPASKLLSSPLTQRQQDLAVKREQVRKQSALQAKLETKQSVAKQDSSSKQATTAQVNPKKSVVSQSQTKQGGVQATQRSTAPAAQSASNAGIESFRHKSAGRQGVAARPEKFSQNQGIKTMRERTSSTVPIQHFNRKATVTQGTTNQGIKNFKIKSGASTMDDSKSNGITDGSKSAASGMSKSGSGSSSGQSTRNGQGR